MNIKLIAAFGAGVAVALGAAYTNLPAQISLTPAQANSSLYAPRDWERVRPSKLNLSVFAFSDRNRNGVFDVADKPLNRLAVRLTRPDASTQIARSNINGFTNFSMRLGAKSADIREAGKDYLFEVLPPPGWSVTTGNARQSASFFEVPGSITGLAAVTPPSTVGFAPDAQISGTWPGARNLLATSDQFGQQTIEADDEGYFKATLPPGVWNLQKTGGPSRRVVLDYAPVVLGTAILPGPNAAPLREQRLVDFEDVVRSSIEKLATGYAGLAWDYLLAVDNQYYKGPGYVNGLMSGAYVAYNSSGHPVSIAAPGPDGRFDFVGAYFSAAWHNAEGETLIVRAFRDDLLLSEDRVTLSHMTPTYFQASYQDISRLELETLHYWQFVVDDLEFGLR